MEKVRLGTASAVLVCIIAFAFAAFAFAAVRPAFAQSCEDALGAASPYNAFFFGDYSAASSDVQGRLAAGGNISIDNYSIADQLPLTTTGATLLAGGDIVFPSGRVYVGDIVAGGSTDGIGDPVRNGLSADQQILDHVSPLPVDFSAEASRFTAWSANLAALPANGTYVSQWGGLYLHGDGQSALQVFALPGDLVLGANTFSVDGIPADATVLFNINGDTTGLTNMSLDSLTSYRTHVLFNFYQATTLEFSGIGVEGSVLAPTADVNNPQGVIWGSIVARSWNGPMQLNLAPFTGCGLPSQNENQPPVANAQSLSTPEDTELGITLSGSDPDNDPLMYAIVTPPAHGALSGDVPDLVYTPDANFNGEDSFDFAVSDGVASATATVSISVTPVNDAPVITSTAPTSARVGQVYDYAVEASDVDGDGLSFTLDVAPSGMTIDGATGEVTWTPAADAPDTADVAIHVSDGHGGDTTQSFTILVAHDNRPPVITSTPSGSVAERQSYEYPVQATDPDGDVLSYALLPRYGAPVIDGASGLLQWTPALSLVGPVLDSDARCKAPVPDASAFADLTGWQVFNVPGGQEIPHWSLQPGDPTTAFESANDSPSMLVGDDWMDDGSLEFSLKTTGGDDDFFGFVWGFRSTQHYYRLRWDRGNCKCVQIEKIDTDAPVSESSEPSRVTLASVDTRWDYNTEYRATLDVQPGSARVRITSGTTLIAALSVEDSALIGGRYGFYNYSQAGTYYRVRRIPRVPAADLVVSSLQYGSGNVHVEVLNRGAVASGTNATLTLTAGDATTTTDPLPTLLSIPFAVPAAGETAVIDQPLAIDATVPALSASISAPLDVAECDASNNTRTAVLFEPAATDPGGLSASQLFAVQVDDVNDAPTIASSPVPGVTLGHAFVYAVTAADPDIGDRFTYSLPQGPDGMSIDGDTGIVLWTPQASDLSHSYPVTVQATDLRGATATQTFDLLVHHDPVITSMPEEVAYGAPGVQRVYHYQVAATDADGQTLSYHLVNGPTGMTIGASTGLVSWTYTGYTTPPSPRVRNNIVIEVDDGFGGRAVQAYTLTVIDDGEVNHPPAITSAPVVDATPEVLYSYQVTATDADGDSLRFKLLAAPDAMQIDSLTGLVTWLPATVQNDTYDVEIEVNDGRGGVATQSYQVSTIPGAHNHAPQITSHPSVVTKAQHEYRYQIVATDEDGDALQYSLLHGPTGMTVDPDSGLLSWTPSAEASASVSVRVSDGYSYEDQSWPLTVLPSYTELAATVNADPQYASSGQSVTIQVTVTGAAGDPWIEATLDGAPLTLDANARAVVTAADIGRHDVVATVHDDFDTVTATQSFFVGDPSDSDVPIVEITSPDDDTEVTAPIVVRGTATDSHLARWSLSMRSASGAGDPGVLASGLDSVTDAELATFDPTQLVNGQYFLTLEGTDISGHTTTDTVPVRVTGDMKVGNFSLTFEDANIEIAGIPIRITRTYDSRRRTEPLDFGYGWSIGYQDVRIEESAKLGYSWQVASTGGTFGDYCAESNGNRVVTITLPDGKVDTFHAKADPECTAVAPEYNVHLVFEPVGDTTDTLEQTDYGLLQIVEIAGSGVYNMVDPDMPDQPVDPTHYRLTTTDGLVYDLDQTFGIRKVTEPSGNSLTFQSDGIVHSSGSRVTFNRDAQGRITRISGDFGIIGTYEYDADGNLADVKDALSQKTVFEYRNAHPHYLTDITDPRGTKVVRNEYDDDGRLTATIDADGHRIEYTHDIAGRVEQVRDRRGNLMTYQYDDAGHVIAETNALGETIGHTYDENGNELSRTDALGHTTTWTYDARGNKLTETDALGKTTTWTYNERNSVLTQVDAEGRTIVENTYDTNSSLHSGHLLTTTDGAGDTTTFNYDLGLGTNNTGELLSIVDAAGHGTGYTVNLHGWRTSETDALGNTTAYQVNSTNGLVYSETRSRTTATGGSVGVATYYTYDAKRRMISRTQSGEGMNYTFNAIDKLETECVHNATPPACTLHDYDAQGREILTTYRDGTTESTAYDENGNVIAKTDRAGRTTRMTYDEANRLIATIEPDDTPGDDSDNPFTVNAYDDAGRLIAVSDERGNTTTYGYDDAGRRTTVTDALGHTTTTRYDDAGRRTGVTDALGHTMTFVYDDAGRLTETIYPDDTPGDDTDNPRSQVEYDEVGRKTADIDPVGRTTRYAYDALGHLVSVVLSNPSTGANPPLVDGASPDSGTLTTSYTYDSMGNKLSQTDANGHTTSWTYDNLNRPLTHTLPLGQIERFSYDSFGRLATNTTLRGFNVNYSYDEADRVTQIRYPNDPSVNFTYTPTGKISTVVDGNGTTAYEYDARDRLTQVTWPSGQSVEYAYDAAGNRTELRTANQTLDFGFDALNRLQTVTPAGDATPLASYTYDAIGNRASITRANSTTTDYTYNARNQLTGIAHRLAAGVLALGLSYHLDASGMRTGLDETTGAGLVRQTAWQYDPIKRLTGESVTAATGNHAAAWTYDAVGNRLSQTKTDDATTTTTTYSYDANDRPLGETTGTDSTSYTYDNGGNLTRKTAPEGITQYTYNQANRLSQLTAPNGDVTKYAYAHDGIRLSQTAQATSAHPLTTEYLIDPNQAYAQVIEESTHEGSAPLTLAARYAVGDDRIAQWRYDSGTTLPSLRYYHADGLGSTRLLTDDAGGVTDTYAYEAFGTMDTTATNASSANSFLYTGEQFDPNAGFYYLRARYMDPSVGRFTQMDSFAGFGPEPRSLHKYLYTNADPINRIDPTGHFSLQELGTSVAVVGVLTTVSSAGIAFLGSQLIQEDKDGQADAAIVTVSGSVGSGGAMAEAGADFILDRKSGKIWAYGFFGPGISPLSLFKNFKKPGYTVAAGLVWNYNDPSDWSGFSVGTSIPWGILHLLPSAAFSGNRMWGAMTQLAKREKNRTRNDLSIQIGVSTSGPVALKVATRTNSFSAGAGWATDPIEVLDVGALPGEVMSLFNDAGTAEGLIQ